MAKATYLQVIAVVFISLVVNSPGGKALTCTEVDTDLLPCLSYVTGTSKSVSQMCCNGLKNLVALGKTKADREAACECMNSLTAKASDEEVARAAAVPGICGVSVPFNVARNADCSKVQI